MADKNSHPDSTHIDAAGGTKAVAEAMGSLETSVSNWRRTGISAFKRWDFKKFCEECGVDLPSDFMEAK